jgi:hypothetical protein
MKFSGHSRDCDCDTSTWECSREYAVEGRTPVTAVGHFSLFPTPTHTLIHVRPALCAAYLLQSDTKPDLDECSASCQAVPSCLYFAYAGGSLECQIFSRCDEGGP